MVSSPSSGYRPQRIPNADKSVIWPLLCVGATPLCVMNGIPLYVETNMRRKQFSGPVSRSFPAESVPLLLGERGVEVEHEGIGVGAEFRNDERHALRHEPGDEGNVAGQAVELGHNDRVLAVAGRSQGSGRLRAPVERVGALAALRLYEGRRQVEVLLGCEAGDGFLLGLDA